MAKKKVRTGGRKADLKVTRQVWDLRQKGLSFRQIGILVEKDVKGVYRHYLRAKSIALS